MKRKYTMVFSDQQCNKSQLVKTFFRKVFWDGNIAKPFA